MKKTILTRNDSELLEGLLASYGPVVTSKQIQAEASDRWSYQYIQNRIQRLTSQGWLIRIKRGLYAISDLSSRGFLSLSPYAVANLLVSDSYVSFEAALAHHGMFDQFTDQFVSVSLKQFREVRLDSIRYRFIKTQKKRFVGWEKVEFEYLTAQIASPEKALVDMIHFRKGELDVDMVIEKLQVYQVDLDFVQLFHYLNAASLVSVKIFGLVLDWLNLDSSRLYLRIKESSSTHRMSSESQTFNAKWRLYYDEYFDKYQKS